MAGNAPGATPVYPSTPGLATPGGHYSHAVVANGFVFVSGELPITEAGEKLTDAPFEAQAAQVLQNLERALVAAGSGIAQLAQVRVYLDDIGNWPAFNEIYAKWAGSARPARAIVPTGLLHFGFKIEIEATAVLRAIAP
ncbi:RidA family protein [Burkholderia sp. WAC0059]|uniref:RidA family protein n=1 Tax=Burkholderia sp. WAC0059 TaxID=2066022 RepID=UPI000C7F2F60|nr:RidA family protein [Burkholderia sp. WAC0059]PLZ01196.1 RidA family protein [Burkholderia sp. WAC0059]